MDQINLDNIKDSHELVLHIAIEEALKRYSRKCIFGTDGNPEHLMEWLDKYKKLPFKIWIRKMNREDDGMSGSLGGDYELFIHD